MTTHWKTLRRLTSLALVGLTLTSVLLAGGCASDTTPSSSTTQPSYTPARPPGPPRGVPQGARQEAPRDLVERAGRVADRAAGARRINHGFAREGRGHEPRSSITRNILTE
jgi:hypothetical protein